jgi:2-succinyl-6-hydroxy-2,4-cyclohexadiene-1-carboxylate synthase
MIQFNCLTFGKKSNPPILFLHGFMGSSADWDSICNALAEKFYCIALDLPGHGQTTTSSNEDFTMEHCSSEIINFLHERKIIKPHLLGYSMGGRIALFLSVYYGEKFSKILLESASPGLKTESERTDRQIKDSLLARRLQMQPFKQFVENWYEMPLFETVQKDKKSYDRMIRSRLQNDPKLLSLSLTYIGSGSQPPLWEQLKDIKNSTLLLTGSDDAKFSSIAADMHSRNRTMQHEIIDDCGHNIHFENKQIFIETISEFLNNE